MSDADSSRRPTVSFIVTCYNHADILKVSLESIIAQKTPPDEIIVADDGSTEETFEMTRELRRTTSIPLIHVWQKDEGFRLNRSRNNALAVASSDYIVFSDGDCFYEPHFIQDHLAFARPKRFVGGTRVHVQPERRDFILAGGDRRVSVFTPHTSKRLHAIRSRVLSWLTSYANKPGVAVTRQNNPEIFSANFSFWRADAITVNGFDERYVGYGGDDLDFQIRLNRAGIGWYKLRHMAIAYHFTHPSLPSDRKAVHARLDEAYERPDFRIPDEVGLARALAEGPDRIER